LKLDAINAVGVGPKIEDLRESWVLRQIPDGRVEIQGLQFIPGLTAVFGKKDAAEGVIGRQNSFPSGPRKDHRRHIHT
jgi:hypothetical protein